MTIFRQLLTLSFILLATPLQAVEADPLKPGDPFDYTKFAFQPKSWEKLGLSLQLIPWTGKKVIFLTILNREPDNAELELAKQEVAKSDLAGYGNLIWSLVNTREFLFIQ